MRIECVLKAGEDFGGVELSGVIARDSGGQALWEGSLGRTNLRHETATAVTRTISALQPELWSPSSPALYRLKVTATQQDRVLAEKSVRFGFRSMEIHDGQFWLNGRPIFLRGIAINPPGRTIPAEAGESRAFAEAYVRCLKSKNVNIFRLSTDESQVWFDVCDELGIMLYAGRYGSPPGADEGKRAVPKDADRSIAGYKQLFESYVSHPSIMMYFLANELPVSGERGAAFSALLTRAHAELKRWDPTRPYIGNAGYGEGREGDVCDVHRYWGWYYNSFLTYLNLRDKLRAAPLFGDPGRHQPLTFTECVGCFTGPAGEFNLVRSKQLGAQLGWTGHSACQHEEALQYQSFMVKQATELFRRLRALNPRLAGIMPFTIFFYNWSGINSFDQMKPKPALEQLAISYQPVLLSWELWTPQVYAGSPVKVVAHVINDADDGAALTNAKLVYFLQGKGGRQVCAGQVALPAIAYFGTWRQAIQLGLPSGLPTGEYSICGKVMRSETAAVCSTNSVGLFIAGSEWKKATRRLDEAVCLYDPVGKTVAAFEKVGLPFKQVSTLSPWPSPHSALVVGEGAWDKALTGQKARLEQFIREGGRVLCLRPEPGTFDWDWLPEQIVFLSGSANDPDYPPRSRAFAEQMNLNAERPDHPVFEGLARQRLALWSDYTGWDQTKPGFPKVYPVTAGFKLTKAESLARVAILADYDRGLEGIGLCELFDGAGSVMLSGIDLVNRAGLDPAADRLLANLVTYMAGKEEHNVYPLVKDRIVWGDYPSEHGVVCGTLNGLVVNAEWVASPTNPSAKPLPPNAGSWNMQPGDQFAPRGRNPFGPYSYSTGSSLRDLNPKSDTGSGIFWVSLPPGRRTVITKVKNPAAVAGELTIAVNGRAAAGPVRLLPGQCLDLRSPLPEGAENVSVRYAGHKTLVLLETRFE